MLRAFLAALAVALVPAFTQAQAPALAAKPVRVLIIGNSLVSRADLADRLARLGRHMGQPIVADAVVHDDYSLEDHWRDGVAQKRIKEGWDFVVLQQGPSSRPENAKALRNDAARFAAVIKAAGAKTVLFSAWPARENFEDISAAIMSYRAAAESVDGLLIPAAETWVRILRVDPKLRLYDDNLHASTEGARLALLAAWFTLVPAGPQDFTEAYAAKIGDEIRTGGKRRDQYLDAVTRAIDEPLAFK